MSDTEKPIVFEKIVRFLGVPVYRVTQTVDENQLYDKISKRVDSDLAKQVVILQSSKKK